MIAGIIPARYASTRLPGKPLVDLKGKTMIQRVYEQAARAELLDSVVVATDDERIFNHVKSFGGKVVMTREEHPSGTDRCYEALLQLPEKYDYVINIQGDEPFLDPRQIDSLAEVLQDKATELATQITPVHSHQVLFDMSEVKVVLNEKMEALYFSRMVIPYIKGMDETEWHHHFRYYRHVGLYAYRRDVLEKITRLPPSSLEKAESLEQLRWLENGFKIKCVETSFDSPCIDTEEDVERIIKMLENKEDPNG